jgi:hypothetical protein
MAGSSVTTRYKNRQFRFHPDELAALKSRAKADQVSEAEVVRRALRAYLNLPQD